MILRGEPGIGKTRLLDELCRAAEDSRRLVLRGRAVELERDRPFAVLVDALDPLLGSLGAEVAEEIGPDRAAELAAVFPSLTACPRPDAVALQEERYRLHAALRLLVDRLARRRPLVLALDDLHWADDASIEFLLHLLRQPPREPTLVALAFRPRQAQLRLLAAVDESDCLQQALAPLTEEEVGTFLGPEAGPELRARLYRETGGNPFYLEQLQRAGGVAVAHAERGLIGGLPDVPSEVVGALAGELATVPSTALGLLEAAAISGDPFELDLACEVAQLSDEEALTHLDELIARDLVRPADAPRRFSFRHPLVAAAAYESAGPGWRIAAHGRAAAALAASGAPPLALAHHVERSASQGDEEAIALLADAARAAVPRAPAVAAHWFAAALRLLPPDEGGAARRVDLTVPMTSALAASGRIEEAGDALRAVLPDVPREPPEARVRTVSACAQIDAMLGHHTEATALLTRELDEQSGPERLMLELTLGQLAYHGNDFGEAERCARSALSGARAAGEPLLEAEATALMAIADYRAGRAVERDARTARAAALIDAAPDRELANRLDAILLLSWLEFSEGAQAGERHMRRALALARLTNQGHLVGQIVFGLSGALWWLGRLAESAELADEAVESALITGNRLWEVWSLAARCVTATALGDVRGALAYGDRAVAAAASAPPLPAFVARGYRALAILEAGDPERCIEELLAAGGGREQTVPEPPWRPYWHEILTRASLALGNVSDAEDYARRAETGAAGVSLVSRTAWALRARAAVELAGGDPGAAAELALDSAAGFEQGDNPIEAARARTLAGTCLVAAGRGDEAVPELVRAHATLAECGAARWRDEAAAELRRLGQRISRPSARVASGAAGIDALTVREREVAELVTEGRTNREVAELLFVTEKTVESHLSKVFAKLGAGSRTEVAATVARAAANGGRTSRSASSTAAASA